MIGNTLSHYTLGSELGRGGMGVVYRAKDSTLDRTVAIKFLASELTSNATARERFIREAKAAAAIEHQSICSIHEIAETEDGATYIVMPYYEGLTLKELIATGKQAPSKALDIGKQVASGLAAAHDKGVIHRDIKPGNVMLTTRNRAIILDFGLAKLGGGSDLTRSRSSVGTLPYMAPEQLRGEKVDQRTDIWGLGTVLYEMVSGQRPFQGEYDAAVTYSILNVEPAPLDSICDDLPEGFCNIIERCLAKNPEDRYQTAEELLVDLERPDSSVPFVATGPPRKTALRFNRPTILTIFSLVLLVLVLVTILRPNDAAETGTKHLAVLKFEVKNPDRDEDLQAFSDGVRSVIISQLSKLQWLDESLTMVPMSPYDSPSSVADAQDRYGASHVLTTEVEEQELGTQITFTLIDVLADTIFTSESLTYALTTAASFPSDVFRSIARLLNTRIDGSEEILSTDNSSSPAAINAYLTGLGYLVRQPSGNTDAAIEFMTAAVEFDSLFARAHAGLGSASLKKYDDTKERRWLDDTIAHSNRALRLDDTNSQVHFTLGSVYRSQRAHPAALREFDLALAADSGNAETYRLRAQSLAATGQGNEAELSFKRAIKLAPHAWRFYSSLGVHYINTGQFELALRPLEKGLVLSPQQVSLLNNNGIALFGLGRMAEAIRQFELIQRLDPEYGKAKKNLATAYFYTAEYELAAAQYTLYLESEPWDYEARGYLADSYFWTDGKKEQALEIYRSALADAREVLHINDRDPAVLGSMSWYFANLGVLDSARVYVERTEDAYSTAGILWDAAIGLGETYVVLGEPIQAKRWITQALANNADWNRLNFSPWLSEIRADIDFMNRMDVFK